MVLEINDENKLYGPLFLRGKIAEVDLNTNELTILAEGLTRPAAVNLDADGNIIGVDIETGEVFKLDTATKELRVITKLFPPLDNLAISEDGLIYASNAAYNGITEVNPETGSTRNVVFGGISSPGGFAVITEDEKEKLLLSDVWTNRTVETSTGNIEPLDVKTQLAGASFMAADETYYYSSTLWPIPIVQIINRASGQMEKMLGGFKSPYGLLPLEDGRLLIADYGKGEIIEVSADSKRSKRVLAANLNGPIDLALSGPNSIYVSEYDAGTISKIDLSTGEHSIIARDLNKPEGLDVLANGSLVVAETGHDRLVKIDPATGLRTKVIATFIPMGLEGWDAMPAPFLPTDVDVNQDGHIFVASDIKNAVYKLTPNTPK